MKQLICIVLALCMLLCGAIGEEADLQAQIDALQKENERLTLRLEAYEDSSVIAVFDGGKVTFEEVYNEYASLMEYYAYLYELLGIDMEDNPEEAYQMQVMIAENLVSRKVIDLYLAENGVELLSAERRAKIEATAKAEYEENLEQVKLYFVESGLSEEEALVQAQNELELSGLDEETLIDEYISDAQSAAELEYFTSGVVATEEDVKALYEERLASDTEYYSVYPEEYGFEAIYSESAIAYVPEGYRRVRLVLVEFDEETLLQIDELYMQSFDDDDTGEAASLIEEKYELLLPEAVTLCERLAAGETFEDLLNEYPAGAIYYDLLGTAEGFPIASDCYIMSDEIVAAAMALETEGDFTNPVKCDVGYVIVQYMNDITPGIVPMEELYDSLYEDACSQAKSIAYENTVAELVEKANPVYFFDRLN